VTQSYNVTTNKLCASSKKWQIISQISLPPFKL
jgi:hypothetical protein